MLLGSLNPSVLRAVPQLGTARCDYLQGKLRHARRAQGRTPQCLGAWLCTDYLPGEGSQRQQSSSGEVQCLQNSASAVSHPWCVAGGCREVSITWAPCVNSSQMEKLAVWLINVVYIKQLGVGGFAWWGGAEQGPGSIQLILSGLNPGCRSEPLLPAGGGS